LQESFSFPQLSNEQCFSQMAKMRRHLGGFIFFGGLNVCGKKTLFGCAKIATSNMTRYLI